MERTKMRAIYVKDRVDTWERRVKVAPKHDGFSILVRIRDMERAVKKTIYV